MSPKQNRKVVLQIRVNRIKACLQTLASSDLKSVSCGRNQVFLRITASRMQFVYKTCVMWTKPSVAQNHSWQNTACLQHDVCHVDTINPVILRITVDRMQPVYNTTCIMWAKLTPCSSESQLTECSLSTRHVSRGQNPVFIRISDS